MTEDKKIVVGFLGAGGIARAHAYALNSLKYYYNNSPAIVIEAVCSSTDMSRESFAARYGFNKALGFDDFIASSEINTVFILGPNKVHYEHFRAVCAMPSVKRIYLEKPVCSTAEEAEAMALLAKEHSDISVQVGFQFLFNPAIRELVRFWKSGVFGHPVHFDLKYYHSDYLKKDYRSKRATRLTPAPDGGAMADLGSHAISLLIALLGENLKISGALQAGNFEDVNPASDLFSLISLYDDITGAAGTLSASRISSGTGDYITVELYADKGAFRYSSVLTDSYEYFLEESGCWTRVMVGSKYGDISSFPSGHVSPGWLRSLIHAHYIFLTGNQSEICIPDVYHGLAVQRLVTDTAYHLAKFRSAKQN